MAFWRLAPMPMAGSIFAPAVADFRLLGLRGREYVLGSNRRVRRLRARLPDGAWRVTQVDLVARTTRTLRRRATGDFPFATPDSRAALTHFKRIADR